MSHQRPILYPADRIGLAILNGIIPPPALEWDFARKGNLINTQGKGSIAYSGGFNITRTDAAGVLGYAPHNLIRNNTMQGAVAGTPGTVPTNWSNAFASATIEIIGTGTENGIDYIEIRYSGTPTIDGQLRFETITAINALDAEVWTVSAYVSLVAGDMTNMTGLRFLINEREEDGTAVATQIGSNFDSSLTSSLQRFESTLTLAGGGTVAHGQPSLSLNWDGSGAVEFTLRIGWPQMNRGDTALKNVSTTNAAIWEAAFEHIGVNSTPVGLSLWEASTNEIRNNTMQGAVAGTPGTSPTNWQHTVNGTTTIEILGTGVENGIEYIDARFVGTPTAASENLFETTTGIDGVDDEVWTCSAYVALLAGDNTNITSVIFSLYQYTEAGAFVGTNGGPDIFSSLTPIMQRISSTETLAAGATGAHVRPSITIVYDGSGAIDITLRIGLPQMENLAVATPVIKTTTAAVTRTADLPVIPDVNWYNQGAGTLYAEWSYPVVPDGSGRVVEVNDASSSDRVMIQKSGGGSRMLVTTTSSTQAAINAGGSFSANTIFRGAAAWATNDFMYSSQGLLGTADTAGDPPTNISQMNIGSTTSGAELNGHLARILYWPFRLPNWMLQSITRP